MNGYERGWQTAATINGHDSPDVGAYGHTPLLVDEALAFLELFYHERGGTAAEYARRSAHVVEDIRRAGAYWHTLEELTYGARVAWRNSNRCIGRIFWKTLKVRDYRQLDSAEAIFAALLEHIAQATNGGDIRSLITVLAPELPGRPAPRIWNPQLIRYAGYRQPDGSILGDPLHTRLTEMAQRLGWRPAAPSAFDVLPLIIQMPGQRPCVFEIPSEYILEVPITHPTLPFVADLGLKWHAVPIISNMRLEIGGISYPAAPFNGWYMGTEIGARNLGDIQRYNLLPGMAQGMGLDTSSNATLWRDRALVELNVAVLHSFNHHGVKIVDHHTISHLFLRHRQLEAGYGRVTPAEWSWIVPPISGSATPVFHHTYPDIILKPNYFHQPDPRPEP